MSASTSSPFSKARKSCGLSARELVRSTGFAVIFPDPTVVKQSACSACRLSFRAGDVCRSTTCGHSFHASCMEDYFGRHRHCPSCRVRLGGSRLCVSTCVDATPWWSPAYDEALMEISVKADNQFRHRQRQLRGREVPPRATLFLGRSSRLPIVKEEPVKKISRETLADIRQWSPQTMRLAVAFLVSLAHMQYVQFRSFNENF